MILALLYINFYSACTFTITCESFLPTLSYIGALRGHDTLLVLALTFQSFLLIPVFSSFHSSLDYQLSKDDYVFFKIHEFIIIALVISTGIIDESSGLDFYPNQDSHRFLTFGLCVLAFSWSFWALLHLGKNKMSTKQKSNYNFTIMLYLLAVVFAVLTILQWHYAYTIYNGLFFNHYNESICEWILVTIAIRFPYYLSKIMNISMSVLIHEKITD